MIGRKPTQSLPWHINVCRQRIRENGSEFSAFAPTGTAGFHEPMKFGHFYGGNSHRFPAAETVTDFLIGSRAAENLMRARKWEEALSAYVALANGGKVTDFQKSDALLHAASCARNLNDHARTEELISQIPIAAVAKTARMENLLAQRKSTELVEQFGGEDFGKWPFWQVGAGAFARGRAYAVTKNGQAAEADLQTALTYTPEANTRTSILVTMGGNRETSLNDDVGALAAYRQNYESKSSIGGADEFRSVQRAAAILTKQGKVDEALAVFGVVNFEKQTGYWRSAMLISRGETLASSGRKSDALADYQAVLADSTAQDAHRRLAQERIQTLNDKPETNEGK